MHIITDSASLITPEEAQELGITVVPACVIVNGETYRDFIDIGSEAFLSLLQKGHTPTSSQPAIGDVMEIFESVSDEILYLSIGDGLSGSYQSAAGARNCSEDPERIHVIDTKTLAGPQRYLVKKALSLREQGETLLTIQEQVMACIDTSVSFVIPADFDFLKRSGRLTPLAAKIGGMIRIVPVLTQTTDKTRITPFTVKRSCKKAISAIIEHFKNIGVGENHLISIGHAGVFEQALEAQKQILEHFPQTETEVLQLSPSLITHGGPSCITIHAIHK